LADANARINIDINTSAAAAGLRQLQSQITAFNSTLTKSSAVQATAMRNSTQNMLELVNASRFFTAETVRMQTAAASLDTTLKKGQVTLGTFLGAKFRKNGLAAAQVMSLANTRAQALQTQFVATGAAANGMRDAIAIRPLQAFNNAAVVSAQKLAIHRAMLNQATTSMINFGKNTQWTGRQLMVGFTVPLTIFGGVAGKVFRDLEKEAVNFKKVYGDSFTPPEEMEANLNAVKELAKEYTKYGIAVKDTVGLAAEAAAAGAQNAELIDATTQATRLATLGQMEQNEALKTTISLQNAFKLSGDELANSINFLNMVENQTVVTLQDLSGAIPRVAPVIKGLGGDVRDLATFLAAMQEGGVSAAQGSMALKSGLASLINPTEKAKERLAEMGISIDTIIQANKGDLMGTVQSLAAALDTLDQFGRQQAIEELFGKFQYARLAALFDNINKEGTQAARVMEISAMSAAEMAASAEKELGAIEEAVGTKFVAAMEQLKLAIAPIGEIFTKMAIPVINFLAKIADAFNNLPDGAKTFIGIATAIVGIVIPAGTMFLGLLVNLIGTLVKFGSAIGTAFRGFLSGGIKGAFDALSQSTKYMSLAEIDAANSAQQLAGSTEAVNTALLEQVGASETAQAAVMELAYAYEILTQQMREVAAQNKLVFGVGAGAMGAVATRGAIRRNRGGTIPGSGNTDTVPAMLTPGEFVVNKQATQDNLPLLRQINESGKVPGYFAGGIVARLLSMFRGKSPINNQTITPIVPEGNPRQQAVAQQQRRQNQQQQGRQNQQERFLENDFLSAISEPAKRRAWSLANRLGIATSADTRGSVGFHSKYNQQLKDGNVDANPTAKQLLDDLNDDTYDSFVVLRQQARTWNSRNPNSTVNTDTIIKNFKRSLSGLEQTKINDTRIRLLYREAIEESGINGRDFLNAIRKPAVIDAKMRLTDQENGLGRARYSARNVQQEFGSGFAKSENLIKADLLPDGRIRISRHIRKLTEKQKKDGIDTELEEMAIISVGEKQYIKDGRNKANIWVDDGAGPVNLRLLRGELGSAPGADYSYKSVTGPGIEGVQFAHANKGGHIVPGVGNKDTVPAMLTPGEFVVNKKATQSNMALLKAINNGTIKGYAAGDIVEGGADYRTRKPFYHVENPDGSISRFENERDAKKASKAIVRSMRGRGVGSGMGRGIGMSMGMGMIGSTAMMGGMMLPGVAESPALSGAVSAGGMGLSMLSMLPMLGVGGPATLAIAGVAAAATAAGVALYKWRDGVDTASRKAAEFGANLGGTANALNNMAALMGQQTPSQRRAQLTLNQEDQEILNEYAQEFQNMFSSEKGQAFIEDLKNSTSAERFKKLADNLSYAIAAGMLDQTTAQAFAKGIAIEIGDAVLGTQVATRISEQGQGPESLINLAEKRISKSADLMSNALNETTLTHEEASKTIGAATQIIQDFSNAEALAREQFAAGDIGYEELQLIIEKTTKAQSDYSESIQLALDKTNDFGATMQAVIEQVSSAGIYTEDQVKELESITGRLRSGKPITEEEVPQIVNDYTGPGMPVVAVVQEKAVRETAAITGQASEIDQNELISAALGLQGEISFEDMKSILEEISLGSGELFNLYKDQIDLGKKPAEALRSTAASEAISSLITSGDESDVRNVAVNFESSGGDLTSLLRVISSIPEDGTARYDFLMNFDLLSPEQQSTMLSDSEKLANLFGDNFANSIQKGSKYQEALEQGTTGIIVSNMEKAEKVFGDATQSIIEYSNKTSTPLSQLRALGQDLSELPQELIFRAGIDVTSPEDIMKFGPIAQDMADYWPILQKLPENINLAAFLETNTMSNGQLKPIDKITDEIIAIEKAMKTLDSTKPEIVKKATIDILVAQGSSATDAETAFEQIISGMEDFNKFSLEDKMAVITIVQHQIDLQEKFDNAAAALESIGSIRGGGGGADLYDLSVAGQGLEENKKKLEAAGEVGRFNLKTGNKGGGGGGGGGQKSLMQQLRERAKLAKDFEDAISGRRVQRVASKPLGGEFIEYLKSQGKPGLKLLKAATTDVKKFTEAYKLFRQAQRSDTKATLELMPQALVDELKAKRTTLKLTRAVSKELKVNGKVSTEIVGSLSEAQQKMVLQEIASGKISDNTRAILNNAKNIVQFNDKNANYLKFMAMSAEDLQQSMRDLASEANDIRRQIAEIDIIRPLQDQLDAQQKIDDGIARQVELKQRLVNDLGRQIELEQRSTENLDDQTEKLEEQKEKVQEIYDEQIEALDKIFEQESEIIALREKSLDVADALSTGDIAAAARAQMELQSELAAQRREDQRSLLEAQNEAEIAAIDEQINDIKEQKEVIEKRIEGLQLRQRNIQDEIYRLEQSRIPVQDEIYRLNIRIANESERLDDAYNSATIQAESLRAKLREVEEAAKAAARAARDTGVTAPASIASAPPAVQVSRPGDSGYDQMTANIQELYGGPANQVVELSQEQVANAFGGVGGMGLDFSGALQGLLGYGMGGKVKKYAMGGMVNYKGSREPAPGFAMGGRVKKYAYGSIVPGIGATDKVPAMLTPGEFVVRKSVAQTYGPLLSAINGNVFPKMGGSSAMPRGSAKESGSMYNYNVNVTLNGSDMNPDDVANAVMRKIKMTENTRVRGYNTRG